MKVPRQLVVSGVAALVSIAVLAVIVVRQNRDVQRRLAVQVAAKPVPGGAVFREKGCGSCHGPTAGGTSAGPALRDRKSLAGLPQLVIAMWNHAPRMWEQMQAQKLPYPSLSYEEMSQLVSYVYISGYADNGGDSKRGQKVFDERKCAACHLGTAGQNGGAPALVSIAQAEDPLAWTQTMWNHASAMQARMRSKGIQWPKFQASEMRDLFAYVRDARGGQDEQPPDIQGDPDQGWELFQKKGCIRCHAISSSADRMAANLGPDRQLPPTLSEFGAALVNHFPEMKAAMNSGNAPMPTFENHDVTDLAVFIYGLHYLEPSGSAQIGKSVFNWRGCSRCHGNDAMGTRAGPGLRGRTRTYTAVRLATDLWRHGQRMYQNNREQGQEWPTLEVSDIGHLLTFLNTSHEP